MSITSITDGLKDASPINLRNIDKKTHVTMELGLIIRGVAIIAMVVVGYVKFMARVDNLESANRSLAEQLVASDSLQRKDFQAAIDGISREIEAWAGGMVTARETGFRAARTALETETSALQVAVMTNAEKLEADILALKQLIIAANSTTDAGLRPLIDNIENALAIQSEAFDRRVSLVEEIQQAAVKKSLFGIFDRN